MWQQYNIRGGTYRQLKVSLYLYLSLPEKNVDSMESKKYLTLQAGYDIVSISVSGYL